MIHFLTSQLNDKPPPRPYLRPLPSFERIQQSCYHHWPAALWLQTMDSSTHLAAPCAHYCPASALRCVLRIVDTSESSYWNHLQAVDIAAIASGTTAGVSIMATAFATSSIVAAFKNGDLGRYAMNGDDYWIAYCVLS